MATPIELNLTIAGHSITVNLDKSVRTQALVWSIAFPLAKLIQTSFDLKKLHVEISNYEFIWGNTEASLSYVFVCASNKWMPSCWSAPAHAWPQQPWEGCMMPAAQFSHAVAPNVSTRVFCNKRKSKAFNFPTKIIQPIESLTRRPIGKYKGTKSRFNPILPYGTVWSGGPV